MTFRNPQTSPNTQAVRPESNGRNSFPLGGEVCQSTTFVQTELGSDPEFAYSRVSNPTVDQLERLLGRLEDALPATCFSTGLAAETALFLTILSAGDHVVAGKAVYGGTTRLVNEILSNLGVEATFVDSTKLVEIEAAIRPNTKLIFIETPANPTLELTDIAGAAEIAHDRKILLAVDNTFLTPVLQKPLDLGADISVYSTTKHIEGHSVALGGAVVSRDVKFADRLRRVRKSTGAIQSSKNAWLTIRGIKTLPLRLQRHSESAEAVARWLNAHPEVENINYPGLNDDKSSTLAQKQHESLAGRVRHGGILSLELSGGYERACEFARNVQLGNLVEHVGGIETLLTHPASMTHADVPRDQLREIGVSEGLLRLSVGLEDVGDIIADLEQAISASATVETHSKEQKLCTQTS